MMLKFDVVNRFTGAVQFTAEIDCQEGEARSVKLGLAVKWAVKNRANLDGANLDGANLDGANLDGANLDGANLNRANLYRASLNRARLDGANLDRANLDGANLNSAILYGANLNRASLYGASLYGASLYGANLDRANLDGASGVNDYIKCVQVDQYPITYTFDTMQIGCQRHLIGEWRDFDDEEIAGMDGGAALEFWATWKDWIFDLIERCPAKPTNQQDKGAA